MNNQWRLILDDDNNGYYNMAVDEALFLRYPTQKIPTLRIYGWHPACVSLGYNQVFKTVLKKNHPFDVVRRITGGASILHCKEITYSLACSEADLDLPVKVKDSYGTICSFLLEFYAALGLKAGFAKDIFNDALVGRYGNFCFSHREHYDLVVDNKKIGGNAQRRNRDVIFQHGSIPLMIDYDAVESVINDTVTLREKAASLEDMLGQQDIFLLREKLAESFAKTFKVKLVESVLNFSEELLAKNLIKNKYQTDEWNLYKNTTEKYGYPLLSA